MKFWRNIFRTMYLFASFFLLLVLFVLSKLAARLTFLPIVGIYIRKINFPAGKTMLHYEQLLSSRLDGLRPSEVKRSYLINIAFKNLLSKKTRSFITIFGMSVGIGIIVLLLSLGYGIERLVISRVASLDELKMVDVSSSETTSLRLDRTVYNKISAISSVQKAIPLVSVVGKITYNKAATDVLVYAAPRSYLDAMKIQAKKGSLYSDNQSFDSTKASKEGGAVAGAETEMEHALLNEKRTLLRQEFNVLPGESVPVWERCDISSKLLGYTTRIEGGYEGYLYWGGEYGPFDSYGRAGYDAIRRIYTGRWVLGQVLLFQKGADMALIPQISETGGQLWKSGCIQERLVQTKPIIAISEGKVLGESTGSAELEVASDSAGSSFDARVLSSDSAGIETVSLQASGGATVKKTQDQLTFSVKPKGEAVVSSGLLNLLSISEKKAVGTIFSSSFIIGKSLLPSVEGKALSEPIDYKIIGVVDDPNNTYFYIPYSDIKQLTIPNVSQLKIVLKNVGDMANVRKSIETLGFRTNSTADTVKQIESLFANLRFILAILGLVALGVAALGMFNTLTVSLLERTREIGGMKTMGMVSEEVQDLFLAEAMIMGISGGLGGLLLGFLVGKGLSLIVSLIAFSQGQGYIDLTYIPLNFTLFILACSFVVGVVTGIYPAQRAKKISALNALRYE